MVDGIAGPQTLTRLGVWRAPPGPPACRVSVTVQYGDTTGARCVETRLVQLGFVGGPADDYFNTTSVSGVRMFQYAAGLAVTGAT